MVAGVDGAAAVHLCTDRPVLLEVCVVTDDGRCVDAFFLPNFIRAAVRGQCAILSSARVVRWVVFAHYDCLAPDLSID